MARLILLACVLAGSVWYLGPRLPGFDAVAGGLGQLRAGQVIVALLAVAVAFAAVAGQERAIVDHLGLRLPRGRASRAAAAAAAVAQTVGFGPLIGAVVRRRLLPELTLGQSLAISVGITLGFFAGIGVLILVACAISHAMPQRGLAQAGLAALAGVLALIPVLTGRAWQDLLVMARFLAWLALDLAALALALWVVLPPEGAPAFGAMIPAFLMALGLGMASGSPGGFGSFEATLLAYLPQVEAAGMIAALVAFRALAFALPAVCGALWAVTAPGPGAAVPAAAEALEGREIRALSPVALHDLPLAEAQLIRQGTLSLLPLGGGGLWLSGRLAGTRVVLGRMMGGRTGSAPQALAEVARRASAEGRRLCLYKIDARMAARARRRGYAVLPVAREAVLDPRAFTLLGPARARLRRKLAHASKAGIRVEDCAAPPLAEMEQVARAWRLAHGRERGFSMGRWEAGYAAGQRVITARGGDGGLLGFVTFHAGCRDWVLDLVRVLPGAPDGTIYAMILHAIEMARWLEVEELSLAAVPVADFGLPGPLGWAVLRATRGAMGLAQFKSTFAPAWRVRYLAAPNAGALVLGALAVARAIRWPGALPPGQADVAVADVAVAGGAVAGVAQDAEGLVWLKAEQAA